MFQYAKWRRDAIISLVALFLVACNDASKEPRASSAADGSELRPLKIAVSNYPLKYFTERIGGVEVALLYLVPEDEDPAFWTPTPEDIRQMQQADLLVFNGADYEKWAPNVTLPESRIVNTSAAFHDEWLTLPAMNTHSHGPEGEHSHEGTDFNTWLDPLLAIQQAKAIEEALTAKRPERADEFHANYAALAADLQALNERLEQATSSYGDKPVVASHPVYGYFARRYGLNLKARLWEPETMPSEDEWAELEALLANHPAKIMLWEGVPEAAIEDRLNQYGVTGHPIIPAGNAPEEGDYLSVWNANVERLESAQP